MKGFDAFAGVIKSGGKTRRAAKMVILNVDHPDIVDFIRCKEVEERKAWALIDAGYDGGFNVAGGAYDSIFYQNANHSVRVTDDFMQAVVEDGDWTTRAVTDGQADGHLPGARADADDRRGDLGLRRPRHAVRHHDQRLAHLPEHGAHQRLATRAREYMFLDDTACNLASLNLMQFYDAERGFDVESFRHACEVVISAHGDHRRQRQLPDAEDRRELARLPAARASATPTSARCSWPAACPTTPTPAATTRRRSPP